MMRNSSMRSEHNYDSLKQEQNIQSVLPHKAKRVDQHDILVTKQEQPGHRGCSQHQKGKQECLSQPSSLQSSKDGRKSVLYNPIVICILITETAERVAYFGFRAILVLYFTDALNYTDSAAVAFFELNTAMAYLSPIVGALLADGSWGRYKTILRFGWMYAFGLLWISMAAYSTHNQSHDQNESLPGEDELDQQPSQLGLERLISFVGLSLVSLGTGGIKPCVSAFGADQVALEDRDVGSHEGTTVKSYLSRLEGDDMESVVTGDDNRLVQCATSGSKEEQIREFFSSFYICINAGALGSFAFIPIIRAKCGFGAAFLVPTIFMTFSLIIFWSQRHSYKYGRQRKHQKSNEPDEEEREEYSLCQLFGAFCLLVTQRLCKQQWVVGLSTILSFRKHPNHKLVPTNLDEVEEDDIPTSREDNNFQTQHQNVDRLIKENVKEEDNVGGFCEVDKGTPHSIGENLYSNHTERRQQPDRHVRHDAAQVLHILPLLLFYPIFWLLYGQQGSIWTLQSRRMALHGLQPEQFHVVNPLQILIFVPLFDRIVYPCLEKRMGWNVAPLKRMNLGMILTAIATFVSGLLERQIQRHAAQSVNVLWLLPQITIMAIAEVLLNVTGLEFAYTQSPPSTQALILALYYLMTAIGDGLGAILFATVFSGINLVTVIYLCSLFMMINWGLFWCVSRHWQPYQQQRKEQEQYDEFEKERSIETTAPTLELQKLPATRSKNETVVDGNLLSQAMNGST